MCLKIIFIVGKSLFEYLEKIKTVTKHLLTPPIVQIVNYIFALQFKKGLLNYKVKINSRKKRKIYEKKVSRDPVFLTLLIYIFEQECGKYYTNVYVMCGLSISTHSLVRFCSHLFEYQTLA